MDSFIVEYKNNNEVVKTDRIIRVKRSKLKDLIYLQEELLYNFVNYNAKIGSLLADDSCWDLLKKISKMLNVIGEEKSGINLDLLEDDIKQIIEIFFTTSVDEEGNILQDVDIFQPSKLSELHHLDYFNNIKKAVQKVLKQQKAAEI